MELSVFTSVQCFKRPAAVATHIHTQKLQELLSMIQKTHTESANLYGQPLRLAQRGRVTDMLQLPNRKKISISVSWYLFSEPYLEYSGVPPTYSITPETKISEYLFFYSICISTFYRYFSLHVLF